MGENVHDDTGLTGDLCRGNSVPLRMQKQKSPVMFELPTYLRSATHDRGRLDLVNFYVFFCIRIGGHDVGCVC